MTKENPTLLMSKKLFILAAKLPPVKRLSQEGKVVPSVKMVKIRGIELLNSGIKTVNGQPIDPSKFYRARKPVVVNHYENLKYNYIQGGEDAVKKYVHSVHRAAYAQLPLRKKIMGLIVFFKSRIQKLKSKKKADAGNTGSIIHNS